MSKKVTRIANALTNKVTGNLPVGEDWYEERMKACRSCEFNSDNRKPKTMMETIEHSAHTAKCFGKDYCTLCTCCIELKCSEKEEFCKLKDLGKKPKWDALQVSMDGRGPFTFSLVNNNPELGNLTATKDNRFIFVLKDTNENKVSFSFDVLDTKDIDFERVQATCGCTLPTPTIINSKRIRVDVELSLVNFTKGLNQKTVKFFFRKNNLSDSFPINLQYIKK